VFELFKNIKKLPVIRVAVGFIISSGVLLGFYQILLANKFISVSLAIFLSLFGLVCLILPLFFHVARFGTSVEYELPRSGNEIKQRIEVQQRREAEHQQTTKKVIKLLVLSLIGGFVLSCINIILNYSLKVPLLNIFKEFDISLSWILAHYISCVGLASLIVIGYSFAKNYPLSEASGKLNYFITSILVLAALTSIWLFR